MKDYLDVSYDPKLRPLTNYPFKLAKYLFDKYDLDSNFKILDIGAGRCEVLLGFQMLGMKCFAADISKVSGEYAKGQNINFEHIVDKEKLPFDDEKFDVVFCKSLIEHLENPIKFFNETLRILKPNGIFLVMTPDWESNMKIFYDDYTHIKPFTKESVLQIFAESGFRNVTCEYLIQLPITWRFKSAKILSKIIKPFVHRRIKIKFLRWSRELQLLGYGVK
jgi:SAM-dependent methyltransferase